MSSSHQLRGAGLGWAGRPAPGMGSCEGQRAPQLLAVITVTSAARGRSKVPVIFTCVLLLLHLFILNIKCKRVFHIVLAI